VEGRIAALGPDELQAIEHALDVLSPLFGPASSVSKRLV
jgi:hypothetical protein